MKKDAAYQAIASVEGAAVILANATAREMELEDLRHAVKHGAIDRLIKSGAATSATAAEKLIHLDEQYAAHLRVQREAVVEKIVFEGKYQAARLRAQLSVEMWAADPDLVELDG